MNLAAVVAMMGALLLFVPQAMWVGIALLGIGAAAYLLNQRSPPQSMPMKYLQSRPSGYARAPQRPQGSGFSWGIKDQKQEEIEKQHVRNVMKRKAPHARDGFFNIPLPVSPEISDLLDLKYQTPTGNRPIRLEKDTPNPLIPEE